MGEFSSGVAILNLSSHGASALRLKHLDEPNGLYPAFPIRVFIRDEVQLFYGEVQRIYKRQGPQSQECKAKSEWRESKRKERESILIETTWQSNQTKIFQWGG